MRLFSRLFGKFILRHLLREKLRSIVTVLGIALGIAVVVAIQMTNASSVRGFERAIETISGRTSLEIVGPGLGLDELRLRQLGWLREFGQASPIIEGDAEARLPSGSRESLRVLGIDILRDRALRDYRLTLPDGATARQGEPRPQEFLSLLIDPRAVILTEKLARLHNLRTGDTVEITFGDRAGSYIIRGLLRDEGPARALDGNFAVMDIAAAQLAFQRLGRLDRIDLRLGDGVAIEAAERGIAGRLPEGLRVQRPARRGAQVEKMLEAFHFNLAALSYIALLVGLFLIYNTVSISVITRREEIGALRALGTTQRKILSLFLAEAAALAVLGCAIGLVLGKLFSTVAVRLTATTVNALYIATAAAPVPLTWRHILLAFAVGVPLSMIAAAAPALEASRVAPTAAMRGSDRIETRFRLGHHHLWLPAALLALAWMLSRFGPVAGLPVFGYASAVAIVFGAAVAVPAVLFIVGRAGKHGLARLFRVEGRLANANLAGAIPRLAISVAALSVSLAMMTAIAVMIGSFRETVVYWIGGTLRADLYLRPATRNNVAADATVSPEVERLVASHPEVAAIDRFRNFDAPYGDGLVTIGGGDFTILLERGNLLFKQPRDGRAAMQQAINRDEVVASESFAIRYRKNVGDEITLPTPAGEARFRIAAIYYDYSSDRGILVMDRATLARHFGEQAPTSLTIYLREGSNADAVRGEILKALGDRFRALIYTNAAIRGEVLRIFDSTFAITYALEAIAVVVAILGVASTLLQLILERRREIAVLRLIGADRRQVRKMVVIEATILGGVSQTIGIAVGLLLSLLLIDVINVQSFGWTIQFHLPLGFLVQSTALILVATAIAGVYPAHRAARMNAAAEVGEE